MKTYTYIHNIYICTCMYISLSLLDIIFDFPGFRIVWINSSCLTTLAQERQGEPAPVSDEEPETGMFRIFCTKRLFGVEGFRGSDIQGFRGSSSLLGVYNP